MPGTPACAEAIAFSMRPMSASTRSGSPSPAAACVASSGAKTRGWRVTGAAGATGAVTGPVAAGSAARLPKPNAEAARLSSPASFASCVAAPVVGPPCWSCWCATYASRAAEASCTIDEILQ